MPYHVESPELKLPPPWDKGTNWVKADMVYAVFFARIDFIRIGRDSGGRGLFLTTPLPLGDLLAIRKAILSSPGGVSFEPPGRSGGGFWSGARSFEIDFNVKRNSPSRTYGSEHNSFNVKLLCAKHPRCPSLTTSSLSALAPPA